MRMLGVAAFLVGNVCAQLSWQRQAVQLPLTPRIYSAVGYDQVRDFLVVFGGRDVTGASLGDTWVLDWNAGHWYNASASNGPTSRYGMSYGMYNRQLYVFGGCNNESSCFNDVWKFSASTFQWALVNISDGFRPSARRSAMGGIAANSHLMVVSCGFNGGFLSDTFVLDLDYSRWILLEPTMSIYSPWSPHSRVFAASVMLSPTTMFVFGGCAKHGPCPSRDAWLFNGESSSWTALDFCFDVRREATAALITTNRSSFVVLFGGVNTGLQYFAQTMQTFENVAVLNVNSLQWSMRQWSRPTPGNRIGTAVTSFTLGRVLLFGGQSVQDGSFLNDIWVLSGDPTASPMIDSGCLGWFTLSLIAIHGAIMFFAFGIVLLVGSTIAHYVIAVATPDRCHWQLWHSAIESVGTVLALIGFVCGLLLINTEDAGHFRSVHGCLGLAIIVLLLVQAFLPAISQITGIEWLDFLHRWLGPLVMIGSFINISFGLFLALTPFVIWVSWFAYVVLALFTIAIIFSFGLCTTS